MLAAALRLYSYDHLHFDGNVKGKSVRADGGPGVVPDVSAEDLHKRVGAAIHDQVVLLEIGGALHDAEQLHHLVDAVKVPKLRLERRHHV